jgi:hypothetical protein
VTSRKISRGRSHAVTSPFPGYTPHVTENQRRYHVKTLNLLLMEALPVTCPTPTGDLAVSGRVSFENVIVIWLYKEISASCRTRCSIVSATCLYYSKSTTLQTLSLRYISIITTQGKIVKMNLNMLNVSTSSFIPVFYPCVPAVQEGNTLKSHS